MGVLLQLSSLLLFGTSATVLIVTFYSPPVSKWVLTHVSLNFSCFVTWYSLPQCSRTLCSAFTDTCRRLLVRSFLCWQNQPGKRGFKWRILLKQKDDNQDLYWEYAHKNDPVIHHYQLCRITLFIIKKKCQFRLLSILSMTIHASIMINNVNSRFCHDYYDQHYQFTL